MTEAEEQPVATPKTPRSTLVRSASSFPQSFPVINRNFSNASSVFGEPAEDQFPQPDRQPAAATAPITEQVEERQAEIPISDATVAGEQAPADKAAENAAETGISSAAGTHRLNEGSIHAPSCSGQVGYIHGCKMPIGLPITPTLMMKYWSVAKEGDSRGAEYSPVTQWMCRCSRWTRRLKASCRPASRRSPAPHTLSQLLAALAAQLLAWVLLQNRPQVRCSCWLESLKCFAVEPVQ